VLHIVADLGNSRLKWGRLDAGRGTGPGTAGGLAESIALPLDDPEAWSRAWERWNPAGVEPSTWAVASVNPPLAARLDAFLRGRAGAECGTTWYRSAADVPIRHDLEHAETAGADRALAVVAAVAMHAGQPGRGRGRGGLVVSCGTAVTVERVGPDGTWQGGAIAPGLGLSARALHQLTAQLPLVFPAGAAAAAMPPPAWGRSTRPALEAGLFWGTVGAVRELLARQAEGLGQDPWLVWTGGDATVLAPRIEWSGGTAWVVPDLVLDGLVQVAFRP
jgi:type III pantothenate kinase